MRQRNRKLLPHFSSSLQISANKCTLCCNLSLEGDPAPHQPTDLSPLESMFTPWMYTHLGLPLFWFQETSVFFISRFAERMSKFRTCKVGCLWCAVLLAALGIVLQLPQQFYNPSEIVELPTNRRDFGHELFDISPVALEFEACAGFAQQLIQLSKILILGFSLGAQVVLPMNSSNAWDVLEMQKLLDTSQSVFREAQCDKPPGPERSFWCREHHVTAILQLDASRKAFVRAGRRMMMIEHVENLAELHNQLWQSRQSIAYVTCPAVLNFTVVEPGKRWDLFWKFLDNIEFWEDIVTAKSRIVQSISEFAAIAKKKSEPMGYATHGDKTVFNVLHLRAEPDWHQFCRFDFIPRGRFF